MPSNYPTSLDSFTDPTSGSSLASPSHSGQHIDLNDAVEKIEAKLGIGSSPASSALDGSVLVANGSGTTTYSPRAVGLWKIVPSSATNGTVAADGSVSVGTAVTSVTLNGVFSADFNNYKVIYAGGTCSTATAIQMRLGASAASYYSALSYIVYSTSAEVNVSLANTADFEYVGEANGQFNRIDIDVCDPFNAKFTSVSGLYVGNDVSGFCGGIHRVAASYTSFLIRVNTGTITGGTIEVYGYN